MKKSGKFIFWILVILCIAIGIRSWDSRGQGFRLYKIQSSPPYDDRWDVECSSTDLVKTKKALSQPYKYLGHGFQMYAFESEDGKYVLKFFRHQRLRLPSFIMAMPNFPLFDEWRKAKLLALSRRHEYLMRSCKTSWDLARHETILIMMHLNVTKGLFPTVEIQDLLGNRYVIELDKYQFLVQKKAMLIKPTISALMNQGDLSGAQSRIDQIFDLFIDCAKKGIQDTDGALIRKDNLGFFENRAIYIDGGKLCPRKGVCSRKEFCKDIQRLNPLHKWLQQEYPVLAEHFVRSKKRAIRTIE